MSSDQSQAMRKMTQTDQTTPERMNQDRRWSDGYGNVWIWF